jgi:WD40 repeat protein
VFAHDGRVFVEQAPDGNIILCATDTGKRIRTLAPPMGHSDAVGAAAFSPDGKVFAYGGEAGLVRLIDVASGQRLARPGHHAWLSSVAFAPDGKTIATAGRDGAVRLWTTTGRELWGCVVRGVSYTKVGFSPDGKMLAAVSFPDHKVWLWDTRSGKSQRVLPEHASIIDHLVFPEDGKVITADRRDNYRFWDIATGKELQDSRYSEEIVPALLHSRQGRLLGVWFAFCKRGASAERRATRVVQAAHARLDEMAFTPDGRMLAWAENGQSGQDVVLHLWEVVSGQERQKIRLGDVWGTQLTFTPDGAILAVPTRDHAVLLCDVATGKPLARLRGHVDGPWPLDFSPDGTMLVSGGGDGTAVVWDITRWRKAARREEKERTIKELQPLWRDLGSDDAARAYRAICALAASPGQSVPALGKLLRTGPDKGKHLVRLVAEMDDERFEVRVKATREVNKLGGFAEPALRHALRVGASVEVRFRAKQLLGRLGESPPSGEWVRALRAVEALEMAATPEAHRILDRLARESPHAWLADDARAAARRLAACLSKHRDRQAACPTADVRQAASGCSPHGTCPIFGATPGGMMSFTAIQQSPRRQP